MEPKEYEISTIQDIFNVVTTENIERFMIDFYKSFDNMARLKESLSVEILADIKVSSLRWIDDGQMNFSIKLNDEIISAKEK